MKVLLIVWVSMLIFLWLCVSTSGQEDFKFKLKTFLILSIPLSFVIAVGIFTNLSFERLF